MESHGVHVPREDGDLAGLNILTPSCISPASLVSASQKLSGFDSASLSSLLIPCRLPVAPRIRIVFRHCRTAICP